MASDPDNTSGTEDTTDTSVETAEENTTDTATESDTDTVNTTDESDASDTNATEGDETTDTDSPATGEVPAGDDVDDFTTHEYDVSEAGPDDTTTGVTVGQFYDTESGNVVTTANSDNNAPELGLESGKTATEETPIQNAG